MIMLWGRTQRLPTLKMFGVYFCWQLRGPNWALGRETRVSNSMCLQSSAVTRGAAVTAVKNQLQVWICGARERRHRRGGTEGGRDGVAVGARMSREGSVWNLVSAMTSSSRAICMHLAHVMWKIHCFSYQSCQQEPGDPRDPSVCVMISNVHIVPTNCSGPETDPLMQTFVSTRNALFN